MQHKPYGSRVRLLTPEADDHWYTVDGQTAEELVSRGLAEPVSETRQAFIKAIRILVDPAELREYVFTRWRNRKHKPTLRAPQSSTGGGDQGLKPLLGDRRAIHMHFPPYLRPLEIP